MDLETSLKFSGITVECKIDKRGFVHVCFVSEEQGEEEGTEIRCLPLMSELDALIRNLQYLRAEYALLPVQE